MKIKSVNNRNSIIGGIVGYTALILFLFIGFYVNQQSYWFLLVGFSLVSVMVYLLMRKIRSTVFCVNEITISGPLRKTKTFSLKNHSVQLHLIGGSHHIQPYTVTLWIDGDKTTSFRLNNSEWEFEEFYHETKAHNYQWKIHEGQKTARAKDYQLFLERRKIISANSKHNSA